MSPERVSVGEEREGHCMQMDRRQKRRGNQQWRVWYEESIRSRAESTGGSLLDVEDSHRGKTEQYP